MSGKTAKVTHDKLVKASRRWLEGYGCRLVATEIATHASETPDAIGWKSHGVCIVVECKTSRADFRANSKKVHERSGNAIGDERWFFTPRGLVEPHEVPDGWGLVEYRESGHSAGYYCRKVVTAPKREKTESSKRDEKLVLISMCWRALKALELVKPLGLGIIDGEGQTP